MYIKENNCLIGDNVKIGDGSIIKFGSVIESGCVIGENCVIGPYAHIHTSSRIDDDCVIGNFVEVKKSLIGKGTKVKHLCYIGDCVCGENVNFGCGVVIANFNGKEKNITEIGNNVFIGCNSNLIAPIKVGNNSFIAAGSSVSKDINEGEFVIERGEEKRKKKQ